MVGSVCPGETGSAQSFRLPAESSVQHRSVFSWKTLRLPPLFVAMLEPFLEKTRKTEWREVWKNSERQFFFFGRLKHESNEVTGPADMNTPEKLHRWSWMIWTKYRALQIHCYTFLIFRRQVIFTYGAIIWRQPNIFVYMRCYWEYLSLTHDTLQQLQYC